MIKEKPNILIRDIKPTSRPMELVYKAGKSGNLYYRVSILYCKDILHFINQNIYFG